MGRGRPGSTPDSPLVFRTGEVRASPPVTDINWSLTPMTNLSTPDGVRLGPVRTDQPDIPSTPHKAYCAGLEASQRGDDLATVTYDALLRWPMDDLGELAELIASASLGYWTGGGAE